MVVLDMAEESVSETKEEVVEVSYACCFCLRREIVELWVAVEVLEEQEHVCSHDWILMVRR